MPSFFSACRPDISVTLAGNARRRLVGTGSGRGEVDLRGKASGPIGLGGVAWLLANGPSPANVEGDEGNQCLIGG